MFKQPTKNLIIKFNFSTVKHAIKINQAFTYQLPNCKTFPGTVINL